MFAYAPHLGRQSSQRIFHPLQERTVDVSDKAGLHGAHAIDIRNLEDPQSARRDGPAMEATWTISICAAHQAGWSRSYLMRFMKGTSCSDGDRLTLSQRYEQEAVCVIAKC